MSKSLTVSLMDMLDSSLTSRMAVELEAPEGAITYALKSAFAAIFAGLAGRIDDAGQLHEIFGLTGEVPSESFRAASAADIESEPLFENSRRMLSTIFGSSHGAVVRSVGLQAGLSSSAATRVVTAAGAMVLSAIRERVHQQRIRSSGLGNLLRREAGDFSSYLPAGLNAFWESAGGTPKRSRHAESGAVEVRAPFVRKGMFAAGAAATLLLGWILWRSDSRNAAGSTTADTAENASRARARADSSDDFIDRRLPGDIQLKVPSYGMESQLLSYIEDRPRGEGERWFIFDRLHFEAASAIPTPDSEEQLNNIASILKAYPNAEVKVGGYTDNTGDRKANQRLSENRAESVVRELSGMGIDRRRLEAEGFGDQHPIADNSTEEGRAKNHRISLRVLKK